MSQSPHPTFINLPQPSPNPDTPSEMPGTPTSTTTSLSALSTTAIKDGHRGHLHSHTPRDHQHNLSTNSLEEAERADRISRLAGFSAVQTLRGLPNAPDPGSPVSGVILPPPQQTATSAVAFVQTANMTSSATAPPGLTPAFFDAAGQPTAATKLSTVGTASASATDTASRGSSAVGGCTPVHTMTTTTTSTGTETNDTTSLPSSHGIMVHEDMLSLDTHSRSTGEAGLDDDGDEDEEEAEAEAETEMDSVSGYLGGEATDEDLASRSVAGFEDRMSDDGRESLVGFGEGAGSTISGPIYHRRPLPAALTSGGSPAGFAERNWGLERSSSGLSEGASMSGGPGGRRGAVRTEIASRGDTPISYDAAMERREAYLVDGVGLNSLDPAPEIVSAVADGDIFLNTTTRGRVPIQSPTSTEREI